MVSVIGGDEQGGDTRDVSYRAYFDQDIQNLDDLAVRWQPPRSRPWPSAAKSHD
ncbi:hypothetical protein FHX82_006552 [Amycolatopsis bartoniae]|uniref:Uncharacterized protein n=1 Tax=Amycolatopsis bartoniae TaxID=941986 RepID=A0A8H9M6M9_9PSEU|nr:hypothetical protein [Amycolatopsis bartoniae]MBB2939466.1 hypothetical protein [Amycolatopsis bartoniae]GHF66712.1 hypothetical protein GCM10017566_45650 [Amycolatopsis bartoniae]